MRQFRLKDTTICINEADLKNDIYMSVTIGAGFAPNLIRVDENNLSIGRAAAKVFGNYIQSKMEKKYGIQITCAVSMRATNFIWKTTTSEYIEELQWIVNELYVEEIDEQLLLSEKQATIERYKVNYKDLEFRGRMKMLEFSHQHKAFQLDELSQDLLDVTMETVQTMRGYMFVPNNTFIFCHGQADEKQLKRLTIPKVTKYETTYLFDVKNYHFLQDQEYMKQSKGDFWCGSMKFERSPILTDLAKEYVVLNIIADIMLKGAYLVEVDPIETSIIYNQKGPKQKDTFKQLITEEKVLEAKKRIYQKLDRELLSEPEQLLEKVGRLSANQIDFFTCLSHLEQLNANDILQFLEMRDYRIREGFVCYYKEDKDYVVS